MLLDRVSATLRAHGFARPGETLVVGVSGGPDSVALLELLHRLLCPLGVRLHVAHLDHQLRPDSGDDARFVEELARRLDVPATVESADVGRFARERRLGIEEAARLLRYSFFSRIVESTGAVGVALGHTADDQVETILLALVRGAGPTGLRGMRVVAERRLGQEPALRIFRPLLDVTRAEIEAYLLARHLEPRRDPSNADTFYRRNRVRHELLPSLRALNPRVDTAILRLGRLAAEDEADFERRLAALWPSLAEEREGATRLRRDVLDALPASLSGRALRRAFARAVGDSQGLEALHVEAARALLASGRTGGTVDWPRGVVVKLGYEWLSVERSDRAAGEAPAPLDAVELAVPGVTRLSTGATIVARLTPEPCRWEDTGHSHADLDAHLAGMRLAVRRRRPGDRIVPLGMEGEKKVQDLLVDAKVPRSARDLVPIVEGERGIVWVAGVRADERYRVGPATRVVLCLRLVEKAELESPRK